MGRPNTALCSFAVKVWFRTQVADDKFNVILAGVEALHKQIRDNLLPALSAFIRDDFVQGYGTVVRHVILTC